MKISEWEEAKRWLTRPKAKPMPITKYIDTMNRLYSNYDESEDPRYIDPLEMQKIKEAIPVSPMVKKPKKPSWKYESWSDGIENLEKEKKLKVAGIKDSALYKLLENPKVLGVELGHDTILEIMNLIQGSGIVRKPKKKPVKVAVVEKPKEIDHIALLSNGDEFI